MSRDVDDEVRVGHTRPALELFATRRLVSAHLSVSFTRAHLANQKPRRLGLLSVVPKFTTMPNGESADAAYVSHAIIDALQIVSAHKATGRLLLETRFRHSRLRSLRHRDLALKRPRIASASNPTVENSEARTRGRGWGGRHKWGQQAAGQGTGTTIVQPSVPRLKCSSGIVVAGAKFQRSAPAFQSSVPRNYYYNYH